MKYILILILVIITTNNALTKNLFDTEYYEVKFTSNNVENKKNNNIKRIKFLTINKIFDNILTKEDFYKINKSLNEDIINTLIQNIVLKDEKIINNYYYSQIKINYNKKKIINYLRSNELDYVEYIPDNFLTIIYEKDYLNSNLFTKKNLHYNFLLKNKEKYNFYKIPNLDFNDKYIVNHIDIENENLNKLSNFINKYKVNDALMIIYNQENNNENYILNYIDKDNIYKVKEFSFDRDNFSNLFIYIKDEIINFWKRKNIIQNNKVNYISCKIEYYNLLELKEIKKKLNNISIIKNMMLENISYKSNTYEIIYYGNLDIFNKLLKTEMLNIKIINNLCKINLI